MCLRHGVPGGFVRRSQPGPVGARWWARGYHHLLITALQSQLYFNSINGEAGIGIVAFWRTGVSSGTVQLLALKKKKEADDPSQRNQGRQRDNQAHRN